MSEELAYLAGAMDSDGFFGIKKTTYAIRVSKDAVNPVYTERCGFCQITPIIPNMLKERYGGTLILFKGNTSNSNPIYRYQTTHIKAVKLCKDLLPYLRVKKQQAQLILNLRETRDPKYIHHSYWFQLEFPDWKNMELVSPTWVYKYLGYARQSVISRMIEQGILIGLPREHRGVTETPRIPKLLVERLLVNRRSIHGKYFLPKELIDWRECIFQKIREANKNGINGTSTYHFTGPHEKTIKDYNER